ncbi:MAG TPA: DUF2723 domain-containing protein, partial [Gemmatimonadales bacterium]|nr:DUF2723 domain-containing protein [Gemmatimonadales bacterium]
MPPSTTGRRHGSRPGFVPVLVVAALVFWLTAYPTITWWDSSQYSLAATTLGVTGPPGSLLLTLLGWPVAMLFPGNPAHALNLLAGVLAGIAAGLVCLVAARLGRSDGMDGMNGMDGMSGVRAALLGSALGALSFAFGETLWEHAVKFTPYGLTAVFTGLILWTMLRWWEAAERPGAWRWLLLLGLLFGLDFSVHRTNALLIPAAAVWILLRRPRTALSLRAWGAAVGGLVAGLLVQLLVIPIAATTDSILNIGDAGSWARFRDYVSLEQLGGGFLVQFFPRKAPFWTSQVGDLLRVLGGNFFRWDGPLGPLRLLPGLVGLLGLFHLWRRDRRLGTAFGLVLLLHAAVTVFYFNIPANFFRPFDRHYLPLCVTFGITVAYGLGVLAQEGARLAATRRVPAALAGLLAILVPASQLLGNWGARDASNRYFTHDFAANALGGLPPNAIVFVSGDNDTFPLWYLQAVEGVRPDVQIVNLSLANAPWYVDQLARRDPSFPISFTREERLALNARMWRDTTLVIRVEGTAQELGLPAGTPVPEAITLDAEPTAGEIVLPADLVVLDLVRTNRWRRPLCFSVTVSSQAMVWYQPYGRLDGLFWRIVPVEGPPAEVETLRTNLLERYSYRGYADPRVRL